MADGKRPERGMRDRGASAFQPGLVLDGRYRLDRPLAEGGMGTVWVGHQIALERAVAVKLLHVAVGPLRARLRREALALAAVHHPAVVEVYDYGETADGAPFLVMELVRGESLGALLHREGPLSAPAAVALMLPLLEGLAAAHRAGIVHRDIKPENVVLAAGPGGVVPKLLDFGIARLDGATGARLTADGGFIGTPAYMPPEQVRGAVADERADVWGAAVVLYEMLAGRPPFGFEDMVAVIRRVLDEPPSYPRFANGLDGKLWGILMAALRKDPAERTPSAPAFRDALAGWVEGRSGAPSSPPVLIGAGREGPPSSADGSTFATTQDAGALPEEVATPDRAAPPHAVTLAAAIDAAPRSAARPGPYAPPLDAGDGPPSIDALVRAKFGEG